MTNADRHHSSHARAQAQERLGKITRAVVLAAVGGTAFIGVVVAKEHPGASSAAPSTGSTPTVAPTSPTGGGFSNSDDGSSSSPNSDDGSSGSSNSAQPSPTVTTNPPVATSGGTSR